MTSSFDHSLLVVRGANPAGICVSSLTASPAEILTRHELEYFTANGTALKDVSLGEFCKSDH